MADLQVANTILEQLGGRRFLVMTGAKHLAGTVDALTFALPRNAKKVTHVKITLMPSDTYRVTFWKLGRGLNGGLDVLGEEEGVYADNLQAVFTEGTGLYTHL